MHHKYEHNHRQASFVFGAFMGAALVALLTTRTGYDMRMRAKDKLRNVGEEMQNEDTNNTMSPYDTPLNPS